MPNSSQFLAFATGVSANVLDFTEYSIASWVTNGFSSGIARSQYLNSVWRQSSFIAAGVAQMVADLAVVDIEDDGDLPGFIVHLKSAIAASAPVQSFNTRTGAVTLVLADVAGAMTAPLTLSGAPTDALHAATKGYVDAVAQGLDTKASVKAATTANITLSGAQTIDGVSVVATDRVLVKSQSAAAENGIYVAAAGAWARATDMDDWAEVPGAFVFVEQGTVNAAAGWVCTAASTGTIGSTTMPWTQFSGAGSYTANAGITLAGVNFALTNMAEATVKGRAAGAGTGAPTDLTPAQLNFMLGFTGTIVMRANPAIHSATELLCDGSAVNRTTYANLFSVIGTTWGAGNGTTTFNLPAWLGKFGRAFDNGAGVDPGRVFAVTQLDAFESHTHTTGETDPEGRSDGSTPNLVPAGSGFSAATSGATGDTETRPVNETFYPCIKI